MTKDGTALAIDSAHLIRSLFALIPVPVAVVDGGGRVVMANSSFSETFHDIANISELPRHEVEVSGKGTFDIRMAPINDSFNMVYAIDVANEVTLRRQVVHLEKMAAVGRLVTGVATELDSTLSNIQSCAPLISRCEMDGTARLAFDVILTEAAQAENAVHGLFGLAGTTAAKHVSFDLNELVRSASEARGYSAKAPRFDVTVDLDSALPKSIGDPTQIKQVIFSLLANAEAAISPLQRLPGTIELRTTFRAGRIQFHVSDNGCSRDVMGVFDGNPDGMGLSICSEILKDHGGELYAWSPYGNGATFTMELPASSLAADDSTGILTLGKRLRGKSVMVIDGEIAMTELIYDVLSRYGADVDVANSGSEGYECLQNKDYDIIICDQYIPELSGQSLYRLMDGSAQNMQRKCLFITSDVGPVEPDHFFSQTELQCLKKPFRVQDLLGSIEKLINQNPPQRF